LEPERVPDAFIDFVNALGNASGWALALAEALLFAYGFFKGWWIPGHIHNREVKARDDADKSLEASTKANEELARQFARLQRQISKRGGVGPDDAD